jgi:hypothetical protein
MELCSFWVINPADGQEGKPEPVKLVFFENGDLNVISLSEDPEYRGAYKLPAGSYAYSGETLVVTGEKMGKIVPLVRGNVGEGDFYSELLAAGLLNDREWDLFYANPAAWKSLRIVIITFGDD